jgi:hypothetical protein
MLVEYMVLLKNENGDEYTTKGQVEIDSHYGYFGDKEFNQKTRDAIYQKYPNCDIIEFKPMNYI